MNNLIELLFKKGGVTNPVVVVIATIWLTSQIWRIQDRIDQAWTIHMQAEWANQVAEHNKTNWIPNPYVIYWNIRQAQKSPHQRIQN